MNVTIVGRGKVGSALKAQLKRAGANVQMQQGRAERIRPKRDTELVVLCVPDAVISGVAQRLEVPRGSSVVHVAGARPVSDLAELSARGCSVGVMHPLVSFAGPRGPVLRGTTFVCDGDRPALRRTRGVCRLLGAYHLVQPGHGPAYHAAAAMLANGAAALADAAGAVLTSLGWKERSARIALAGLLRSVADNVEQVGLPGALTGPIVRGDATTVRRHIHALSQLGAAHARVYTSIAPAILSSATRAGLQSRDKARIRAALNATGTRPRKPRGG